jgi:hypothetical protein
MAMFGSGQEKVMNHSRAQERRLKRTVRPREQGRVGLILLLVVCFVLGIGVSAFWFYCRARRDAPEIGGEEKNKPASLLSDSTRAVLQRLDSPIEIRFYSVLDPATVPDALQAFAGRVDQLLSEYERESAGKLRVTRFHSQSDLNTMATAASADGIQAFNLDTGNACFLGLTVLGNGQKQVLSRLAPEWEAGLESDLSRAIEQVGSAKPGTQPLSGNSPADPATIAEVKRVIPDPASVSLEEGARLLRESVLKDFQVAAKEMQVQLEAAQQQLAEAQSGKSEADQQSARKRLQEIQAEQTEKLKQIAARAQAQVQAFQQLKAAAR